MLAYTPGQGGFFCSADVIWYFCVRLSLSLYRPIIWHSGILVDNRQHGILPDDLVITGTAWFLSNPNRGMVFFYDVTVRRHKGKRNWGLRPN